MIKIVNSEKCCGCTACFNICPKNCITMEEDREGFLYPNVDITRCIDCNMCEKVCPVINGYERLDIIRSFAVRSTDNSVLLNSTSGGIFSSLAQCILKMGGIVCGVVCDNKNEIKHSIVQDISDDISLFRGSKYVQSYLGDSFQIIKSYLEKDTPVLFSGTSCQIAGLKNYLRKDYHKLYTVEVICHGTPSPKLWREYIKYQEKKYNSKVIYVNFRNKKYGYHSGTMALRFENGKKYFGSGRVDYMLKSFFSEISSRPSCYSCICKGEKRPADISIFDCWHAGELVSGLKDDDKGYTNVIINSDKAMTLLSEIDGDLVIYPTDAHKAIEKDGVMICNQPRKHSCRDDFYKSLNSVGISQTVSKYIPVTSFDIVIEKSKMIIYKTGLFRFAKKLKKRK